MRKEAIHWGYDQVHVITLTACLQCPVTYCLSCHRGCPVCGFLRGMDRRSEVRQPVIAAIELREGRMEEPTVEHCPLCGHMLSYDSDKGWTCTCGYSDRSTKEAA